MSRSPQPSSVFLGGRWERDPRRWVLEHSVHVPHFQQLPVRTALRLLPAFRDRTLVGDAERYWPATDVIAESVR